MPIEPLYPLHFRPILKRLIWGGRRLGSILDKPLGGESDYAESWEVADHKNDVSVVADGPLAGRDLRSLIAEFGETLLGSSVGVRAQFPLLVKFLDAHQVLSVQVHPDDAKARVLVEDNGKTEAWVILHAEPGSLIYAGLRPGVTREAFAESLETGEVEPLLHRFAPKVGDCVMIPAGTVHAIGAGIVLAEIQQMSDATFRVYDWGRVGADGSPRTLHKPQALEATDYEAGPVHPHPARADAIAGGTRERLASCDYFAIERLRLTGAAEVGSLERFTLVLAIEGAAEIVHDGASYPIARGQTRLLPAALGPCEIRPIGEATVLTCVVP
ncbi:MAG: phosphomannose isomerase [Planctomycetota bacterium]|nr:phosphomannose isomerase [Planctomycetota bacterium]